MSARTTAYEREQARTQRREKLFDQLAGFLGTRIDGQGWAQGAACPNCGKARQHFAFHRDGRVRCFACGYPFNLEKVAAMVGVDTGREYTAPVYVPPAPAPRPWQARAGVIAESLAQTPGTAQAWQRYKPLPADVIASRRLGYGVFPGGLWSHRTGRCEHPRLIVPIYREGRVTGFRCRAAECACDKWLSPGGSKLWLYEIERAHTGRELWVVENPIDALLLQARGYAAAATFGASIWNDEYTAAVVAARPVQVIVAGDNDEAGRMMNERITRALRVAHVPAEAYPWPAGTPEHYDIGQLLAEGASA